MYNALLPSRRLSLTFVRVFDEAITLVKEGTAGGSNGDLNEGALTQVDSPSGANAYTRANRS